MNYKVNPIALFRLSVLGTLTSRECLNHGEVKKIIRELAKQTYHIPNSKRVHLSEQTIERWYYAWKKGGIDALAPKTRSDKGDSKLAPDLQKAILDCKRDNPARSLASIIKLLEMQGVVQKNSLARASVHRLLKKHGISKRQLSCSETIERRSFEALFPGDIWYGDVMHGPRIQTAAGLRKVFLVTVMDDASRLICHTQFCLDETAVSIECVLKEALLKRGLPKRFVIDNGPAYRADTLQSICARLSIRLLYCRPYEPEAKGKLERFHRTFRTQFLTEINPNNIKSLDELNAKLWVWIERIYHQTPHSGLGKNMSPIMRWQQDLIKVTPLGNIAHKLDNYFYHRVKRLIRKDATLTWNSQSFEVDFNFVGQHVFLVIDPHQQRALFIESLDNEYLGPVAPLDKIANNQRKRARPNQSSTTQSTSPAISLVDLAFEQATNQMDITQISQLQPEKLNQEDF